jgi:L-cysteine:1D-myo-inositol 2-amino-2-deoxy-alpha-D-glucopyranoside ligase
LLDTAQQRIVPVTDATTLTQYVCGITPYDAAHLGHAATYVAFDLVQRVARDAGLQVRYVQNVTDVDDPLLERAAATGDDWAELAARETDRFRDDMAALAVLPPDAFVGVVESMDTIVAMIEDLQRAGAAYAVEGDWYFSVQSDPGFGDVAQLAEPAMLALFAERGGDPDRPGKKHPLDSLLWSARREGEPWWDASLGPGRPGWHVECVAIARHGLGIGFDLQGGGSDLVFPHHQMCVSVSRALDGQTFAHHFAHTGMVALGGEKMSKSKGNLEFVSRLRSQGADPRAIRLALMAQHYRADWEWVPRLLDEATARLGRWTQAATAPAGAPAAPLVAMLRRLLADDLDAPAALRAVDEWCAAPSTDVDAPSHVRDAVDALLGVALG